MVKDIEGIQMYKRTREENVLAMQLCYIQILAKEWKVNFVQLSDILREYDILGYIDVCYEKFNSTGNQGVINEIEDYIRVQGGVIR